MNGDIGNVDVLVVYNHVVEQLDSFHGKVVAAHSRSTNSSMHQVVAEHCISL